MHRHRDCSRAIVVAVDLDDVDRIGAEDQYLAVVATARADGTIQASVVNAGMLAHPVSGERIVGFVTYGRAKLSNLRRRPRATIVFRAGWRWASVEGACEIIGPDDPFPGFELSALPALLRSVFRAAGGTHEDWETFDRVMREERRSAVLVYPERIYSNQT
jgi:PPOX class probable F420-dependent enzyme